MSSLKYLVYDIETVTDKTLLQKVLYPEMKGQVEQAYQNHLKELAEEGRDFVNPAFHQPVALAALALGSDFEILKIGLFGHESRSTQQIVEHFWETYNQSKPTLIDFNGKGFDIRVMELWAFRLGISISQVHYDKFGARYRFNEDRHFDLHEFLSNFGAIRFRGGLDLFSKILNKPGKMSTKGDMVQDLFDQKKLFEIEDYCLGDAMDTYFVFLRTLVMRGVIDLSREQSLVSQAIEKIEQKNHEAGYFKEYLQCLNQNES